MQTKNRQLNNIEIKILSRYIQKLENELNRKLNWPAILIVCFLCILFAIHIYNYDKSNWSLISKFLIGICPVTIWILVENKYKNRKNDKQFLLDLKHIETSKTINIIEISATRIIEFSEKNDEGAHYLIELKDGQCLYMWDEQYLISENKQFPCKQFEIYIDRNLKYAIEEKVNCKGDKIEALKIPGKVKWEYFKEKGFPLDLEIETKTFDQVIEEIKMIT